jgi:hypothetical protein
MLNYVRHHFQTCLLLRFRRIYYAFFYSKLRPTFEPDYSTLEQTSFLAIITAYDIKSQQVEQETLIS